MSSLTLSDVTLVPTFDSATISYTATVEHTVAETTVTATPTDSNATVVVNSYDEFFTPTLYADGIVPLNYGSNTLRAVVTAEDGTTAKFYQVVVTRLRPIAERTINSSTVAPGENFTVTMDWSPAAGGGQTYETLPDGFSWVFVHKDDLPSSLTVDLDPNNAQILRLLLLGPVDTYTYEIAVADTVTPGTYEITGRFRDSDRTDHTVVGDSQITVAFPPSVAISPTDLTVNEGSTGTYTVKLNTQPSDEVTITIVDPTDNTDVSTSPESLSFSTTRTGRRRRRSSVTAAEDGDPLEDTATVTHTVAGGDYDSVTAPDVAVTVTDNDTRGLTVSRTSLTVNEGSSTGTYTVELDTLPTSNVTVVITSNNSDVTVSSSNLTFSTTNWNTAQTVTVTAGQDADAADDMATLTHNPRGADYGSVSNVELEVTVTDDDTARVTVSKSSLTIEEGDRDTYTVVLDTEPTATVRIGVADNSAEVSVNPATLTFTTGNWNTARTVTVASMEDRVDEDTETATVMHTVRGGDYAGLTAAAVTVRVEDDDTRDLILSPASLTVAEGDRETYTVKLDSQPTAEVIVSIGSNITDVSVNPATLTFTTSNWASPKAVTATAHQDDIDKDAGVTARLTHDADGGDYGSESDVLVVTVDDNDTREVTVSESSLTIREGNSSTYTVELMSAPTSDVTIGVSPGNGVSVSSSSLTFTAATWSAAQTVTVSATDNDIDEANRTVSVTHSVGGGDYGFNSVTAAAVTVEVEDNDTRDVRVTPTSLMVNEGDFGTYTVVLRSEPTATVTVTIVDPTDNTDVTANPASLRFLTSTWDTAQTVTVLAAEDADALEDTATVTHTVAGGDYQSFAASSVSVTVQDNDMPGVAVSPSSLTIDEGATGTYTVELNTQPSGNVTVAIRSNNTDVTASSTSLTFSTSNWSTAQTVTVTAGRGRRCNERHGDLDAQPERRRLRIGE